MVAATRSSSQARRSSVGQRTREEVGDVPHADAADAQLPVEQRDDAVAGGPAEQEVVGAEVHVGERGVALLDPPVEKRRVVRRQVDDEVRIAAAGALPSQYSRYAGSFARGQVAGGEEERVVDRRQPVEARPSSSESQNRAWSATALVDDRLACRTARRRAI